MCGIVGIVHRDTHRDVDRDALTAMRDLMSHRGPDEAGLFVDRNAGLGHTRLSIIDLAGGHQPMSSEDGSLSIVFNGEIYNYVALRQSLQAKGFTFRTQSDTEVILRLFEAEGEAGVSRLNGIFAFAIWNSHTRSLFLARDHMGVKPLYYAMTSDAFVFASEIKAILRSGIVESQCRADAVYEYFVYRQVSGERTLYENVQALLPASTLTLRDGVAKVACYWHLSGHYPVTPRTFNEASDELAELLEDAVKAQLVSDVPLGAFCSGGIDSSLVTAIAARLKEGPIDTFSIGFAEVAYDESEYARAAAAHCGTRHHELTIDGVKFADLLPRMIWYNDAPLNFANSVQIYALSRLAKEFVTVVLTGEGADELFGGYPRYFVPGLSNGFRKLPQPLRDAIQRVGGRALGHRLEKVQRAARRNSNDALLYNAAVLEPDFVRDVLRSSDDTLTYRRACLRESLALAADSPAQLMLLDQRNYLVSILERQDKMSMGASIESRVPFLDPRLVEFANALPTRFRVRGWQTKAILKRVARKFLPAAVIERRKSGFGVPLRQWFAHADGLGRYLDELRVDRAIAPYVNQAALATVIDQQRSGGADHSEALWTAVNFMLWMRGLGCLSRAA